MKTIIIITDMTLVQLHGGSLYSRGKQKLRKEMVGGWVHKNIPASVFTRTIVKTSTLLT